ncbi:MAG: hypothetical protein ACYTXC_13235 [Nostoc sp.]
MYIWVALRSPFGDAETQARRIKEKIIPLAYSASRLSPIQT